MLRLVQLLFAGFTAAAVVKRTEECYGPVVTTAKGASGSVKYEGYKHVAMFSFDGMHASDVDKYLALRGASSNLFQILEHAHRFTGALTTFPSDSFPGSVAPVTGAHPRTTGVWYDDVWDRSLFAPASGCKGAPGAEIIYDETCDYDLSKLFSGGINATNLPMALKNGVCAPLYPHSRIRVNTAFEEVVKAGMVTAYADKHPTYDIMRGPSGTGLTTGYFPEINDDDNFTDNVTQCIKWDTLHLNAFLGWLDGKDPANAEGSLKGKIPNLWGGNFQSISVGQKTAGYVAKTLTFTPDLLKAMDFMDAALGAIVKKLKAVGLYDQTLIIVNSKHGQAGIDPTAFQEVNPKNVTAAVGVPVDFITFDDIGLVYLTKASDLATAVANLNAKKAALRIADLIYGQRMIDLGYGNSSDPAIPNIVIQPITGTIYTTSKAKIAEHGGGSIDDRNVATFVAAPRLSKKVFTETVETVQLAPIVMKALGLDPAALQGVVAEGTKPLPGGW